MKIMLAGGLGYIGSHIAVELLNKEYEVVIVDDLSNSNLSVLDKIEQLSNKKAVFYHANIIDKQSIDKIFKLNSFDAIIHLAGYKSVAESIDNPLKYYENNLLSTINIAHFAKKYKVKKIVFSSSATVYGNQEPPLVETMNLSETTNPYGETKKISERILKDFYESNKDYEITILRYFNPVGAHKSGLIGENPKGIPNNLMPYITQVAKGIRKELNIFGDDYATHDGTGVRDYIHVVDLAKGHVAAIENSQSGYNVYNLGTGKGISVFELVSTFMKVNNVKVPFKIAPKREGDVPISYADSSKAQKNLKWSPMYDLTDMVKDAWNYEIKKSNYKI